MCKFEILKVDFFTRNPLYSNQRSSAVTKMN